jgi:acyl-lipid omega-6 desaturase (Delta-12 desaturase)
LVFIPVILFVGLFRTTKSYMNSRQRMYVHLTTLAILLLNTSLIIAMGFMPWLMIQLPVIFLAAVAGVWLFYVQHQYSDVVWKRSKDWNYKEIALKGSSFYKLPRVLQWFSGNIGFHHIHHLGPRIPNYKLEKCHYENEDIWQVKPLTLRQSMRSLSLRLWDEENQRLIPFSELS